ncbi:ATP-binding protein [Halosimplex sp. J119]
MNLLLAAQSGWGKSFKAQHVMEENIPEYEHVVVLDYKDEYRGLPKAGLARWWIAGPRELKWSPEAWKEFIEENGKVVLARHERVRAEQWREMAARVISGARRTGDVLIVIDEAHFVAPQKKKVPEAVSGLATTGRGEGASSIWVTQRLSKAEEDVVSQCQARLLGGFESSADLNKVENITEYPKDLHNPQIRSVPRAPEELLPPNRDEPMSLQKHVEDGDTVGSEWIYSDNEGTRERRNTRGLAAEMDSTHYGKQGKGLKV